MSSRHRLPRGGAWAADAAELQTRKGQPSSSGRGHRIDESPALIPQLQHGAVMTVCLSGYRVFQQAVRLVFGLLWTTPSPYTLPGAVVPPVFPLPRDCMIGSPLPTIKPRFTSRI
jgi:hypothetical protein